MIRDPALIGLSGVFHGEVYPLEHFKTYIVGRSRGADISARRTECYRLQSEAQRDADTDAKTISARHFQITVFNLKSIEVKNLSVNGTRLDGKPIGNAVVISDIGRRQHSIEIGTNVKFKLGMAPRPAEKTAR